MSFTKMFLTLVALATIVPSEVTDAVKKDSISLQDQRIWYTVYKGTYLYVKDYEAVGSKNFGDLFDKMRIVRDQALPAKGNVNFVGVTNLKKYEDMEWTAENKSDFAEDIFAICQGLKESVGASDGP